MLQLVAVLLNPFSACKMLKTMQLSAAIKALATATAFLGLQKNM
jgi:hypothetical protein